MPESSGNKHRDYSKFDGMSTEMLEDILRADSQLPDGENTDTDAILYIMEVIAKREKENQTGKYTDAQVAWASFRENYMPYTEDDKPLYDFEDTNETGIRQTPSQPSSHPLKKRRLLRAAAVAAIITFLFLASTITASAFGFDLWGAVAKWTKDTFGFSSFTPKETMPDASASSDETQSESFQKTLDEYGVTALIAPSWFPDGYLLENIEVTETPVRTTINAVYTKADDEISITVILLTEPLTRIYEKDENEVIVYTVNGIDHYIMMNLGRTNVAWTINYYECSITCSLSVDETKKVINSIYERK